MINRDKYTEYLDSALIHKLINGLDPKLSKKIFSIRFHPPFLASGQRFFDCSYKKQGLFIVRDKITGEFIRAGHSFSGVRKAMYNYICRLPASVKQNCDCAILPTHNGEQKEVSVLLEEVIKFELEYHNYFLLRDQIEDESMIVDINKLERVFPYTGRKHKILDGERKEHTISSQRWLGGVYFIWKDDKIDYIGMGQPLVPRLYYHFIANPKLESGRNAHHCVFYSQEDIEQGRIKIAIIPVYRKVVNGKIFPWEDDMLRAENNFKFRERILKLESRLIWDHDPKENGPTARGIKKDDDKGSEKLENELRNENKETMEEYPIENFEDIEDPPF